MAAIFPPSGKPPSPAICNGFTPEHRVIGEGPLYAPADCTSVLTDCTFNAIVSEILAAVDALGFPYNTSRVTNLGDALTDEFNTINRKFSDKLDITGGTMEGPLVLARDPQTPLEAAPKRYVDLTATTLDTELRAFIEQRAQELVDDYRQRINELDARKINRIGDTMQGALILARQPVFNMEAVPKSYVDNEIANIPSGGGGDGGVVVGMVPEAPSDDTLWGRMNRTWQRVIDDGEY